MQHSQKSIVLIILLYLFLGCVWISATDYLLGWIYPDNPSTLAWQTAKGLAYVLGTGVFFYLALRSTSSKVAAECAMAIASAGGDSTAEKMLPVKHFRLWVPMTVFVLLSLVLIINGIAVYRQISGTIRKNAWANLQNVAGLKVQQIKVWHQERSGDVATITRDGSFMNDLQTWLQKEGSEVPVPERIARRMNALRQAYAYQEIMIYDVRGVPRYRHTERNGNPLDDPALATMFTKIRSTSPALRISTSKDSGFDFVMPLATADGSVFGMLVLGMTENNRLFPELNWRPDSALSAETLLVQESRDGEPMVFVFSAGEDGGSAQNALDRENLLAFAKRMNQEGLFETADHRGVPVLAAVEMVPGFDWMLVTKVDQAEVYLPLFRVGMISGITVLFLVGVSGIGIGLWWRQQMAGFALERVQGQLQRKALRKHFEYLTRFANDIVLLLDDVGCVVEANERAVEAYGYPRSKLIGLGVRDLRVRETMADFDNQWQTAFNAGIIFETRHRRSNGSEFPVEVSARRIDVGGKVWCQSIIRDISERKQAEQKIHRLTSLYNVLSQTNQAIVHHQNRQDLFGEVCRIAVQLGFLRMAVIVSIDRESGKISPVSAFGAEESFLKTIGASGSDGTGAQEAVSQVLKEKRAYVCNDVALDPLLCDRREIAELYGWRSKALFPLFINGEIFGVLNLYAAEKDFFAPDMMEVLNEMATDITFALNSFEKEATRKKTEERFRETSATLKALHQAAPLPIMIIDLEGRATFWNPAAQKVFGWSEEEILNRPLPLIPVDKQEEFLQNISCVKKGEHLRGVEVTRRRSDGRLLDMLLFAAPLYNAEGNVEQIVAMLMDVSEQKQAREHIVCLAHYDQLTGLANRTLLRERFSRETSRAQRDGRHMALCLIDLDKFKTVNDALGHSIGDKLLVQVARRLEKNLRRADVVCRPGGDEFLLLLTDLENPKNCGKVILKILKNLEEPYSLDGHTLRITASMGVSIFPEDGVDLDTLFRNADAAMYSAKDKGRNNFMFFRSQMNQRVLDRLDLENSIRIALEEKNFFLHYQPQVDIQSGQITGAEALLRYSHPERGLIPPDQLIPVAEDSGLIVGIGEWVIDEACRQLNLWDEKGLTALTMAINLSPVQIFQENFAERAKSILDGHRIAPGRLTFELTESIFMKEDDRVRNTLFELKKLGVSISLDDFGTGYSSLSYLKRYAVDELKIDRAFVKDVCSDLGDAAIVRATIQMAHSLGLTTVAEGVEAPAQLEFLRNQLCDSYQGYWCSPPLGAEEFLALFASGKEQKSDCVIPEGSS